MSYQEPTVDVSEIQRKYHAAEREEQDSGKQPGEDAKKPR
jgi:hypothetical protein